MMNQKNPNRRQFFRAGSGICLAGGMTGFTFSSLALADSCSPNQNRSDSVQQESDPMILKSLKIGMVGVKGSLTDKLAAAKAAGFAGIELDSPGFAVDEAKAAIKVTGLPVDGTVCSTHWQITHTSPDAEMRKQALTDLKTAIRDTHAVGGNTVLLVVGKGSDGPEKEIWSRAIENISKAIPTAARYGITIALENVWNRFMYEHGSKDEFDSNQTADKYIQFIDEMNSPWFGMQFDIGNHWKYGDCGSWIRALGKRIVKLDVKGYSRAKNNWAKLGEDDIKWDDVQTALKEIGFTGWAAAEVGGGGPDRLKEISNAMDVCLGLDQGG